MFSQLTGLGGSGDRLSHVDAASCYQSSYPVLRLLTQPDAAFVNLAVWECTKMCMCEMERKCSPYEAAAKTPPVGEQCRRAYSTHSMQGAQAKAEHLGPEASEPGSRLCPTSHVLLLACQPSQGNQQPSQPWLTPGGQCLSPDEIAMIKLDTNSCVWTIKSPRHTRTWSVTGSTGANISQSSV